MPAPRHRYTLVGFSDELDWRELTFVEPIPWSRICQACRLVARVTALLPCRHVFCENCYEQCRSDNGHCCPLDGEQVPEENVEWMECPVHNLLKRKVKCWNEDRGCDVVLSASELNKHFCRDCDHHSISCPRCLMVVRCNNVCAHMQSQCKDHVMSVESGSQETNITGEKAMMALNEKLDTRVGEMKDRLDHLSQESSTQSNRLDEISHCINTVKETVLEISNTKCTSGRVASSSEAIHETLNEHGEKLEQLARAVSNSHETLKDAWESTKRSIEQLKENTGETLKADLRELLSGEGNALKDTLREELGDATRTICSDCAETVARIFETTELLKQTNSGTINSEKTLALMRVNIKRHEFLVQAFQAIKEIAFWRGYCRYDEKKIYISGYHLSPGVSLIKNGDHVFLHPSIQLHKGVLDDVLQWPFKEKLRLTIKHPSQKKECGKEVVPAEYPEGYGKPDKASNAGVYFGRCPFSVDDLEREGYVADDKLRVVWELVSKY